MPSASGLLKFGLGAGGGVGLHRSNLPPLGWVLAGLSYLLALGWRLRHFHHVHLSMVLLTAGLFASLRGSDGAG